MTGVAAPARQSQFPIATRVPDLLAAMLVCETIALVDAVCEVWTTKCSSLNSFAASQAGTEIDSAGGQNFTSYAACCLYAMASTLHWYTGSSRILLLLATQGPYDDWYDSWRCQGGPQKWISDVG